VILALLSTLAALLAVHLTSECIEESIYDNSSQGYIVYENNKLRM